MTFGNFLYLLDPTPSPFTVERVTVPTCVHVHAFHFVLFGFPHGCQMNAAVSGITSRHNNTQCKKIGCFFLLFYFKGEETFPRCLLVHWSEMNHMLFFNPSLAREEGLL